MTTKEAAANIITVISHVADPAIGVLRSVAQDMGYTLMIRRPFQGDSLPSASQQRALIILGGPQSAYDTAAHPYLLDEITHLRKMHRSAVPILGLCLGSHLLADALGGRSRPGESGLECGFINVVATTPDLPVGGRYFSFHSDTAGAPAGAEILARSDRYLQAWRVGSSTAIQFHPELDADGVDSLLDIEGPKLARYGVDVPALRACVGPELSPPTPGEKLLTAWLSDLSGN